MSDPIARTTTPDGRERAADRPPPRIASLAGVAAGLLLLVSLTLFLSEIGGDNQRIAGLVTALLFEGLGVGLLLLDRNGRAATAGVTLTALGLVPLGQAESYTSIGPVSPGFGDSSFDDPSFQDPSFQDPGFGDSSFDDPSFQDPGFDPFDVPSTSSDGPENPATRLGIASLLFGGAYLAAVRWRDRRGDRRQGTVFVAVAIPILTLAVFFLADSLETTGSALLAIGLGAVAVWFGTSAERRFTSWYGTFAAVIATVALVDQAVGASARLSGLVLLVVGLAVALVAMRIPDSAPAAQTDGATSATVPPWTGPPGSTPWTGPPGSTPWGSAPPPGAPPGPATTPPGSTPPPAPDGPDAPTRSPWDRPDPA